MNILRSPVYSVTSSRLLSSIIRLYILASRDSITLMASGSLNVDIKVFSEALASAAAAASRPCAGTPPAVLLTGTVDPTDSNDNAVREHPASARDLAAPDTIYPKSWRNPLGRDIKELPNPPGGFQDGLIFHRADEGDITASLTKFIRTSSAVDASIKRFFNLPISSSGIDLKSKLGVSQSSVSSSLGMSMSSSSMLFESSKISFNCLSEINFRRIASAPSPTYFRKYSSIRSMGRRHCDVAKWRKKILRFSHSSADKFDVKTGPTAQKNILEINSSNSKSDSEELLGKSIRP
ncbi:unnamed protein product [Leptidea sinapis]|uniref:Uncharacterized protein n=1 Tax=Leptidea sinapis TaxID=189913 RepID=A0A5E4QTT6_9NEOP|nr:unnamed protein product [Leptidea sinapis]